LRVAIAAQYAARRHCESVSKSIKFSVILLSMSLI
jgi:hypothetical protein